VSTDTNILQQHQTCSIKYLFTSPLLILFFSFDMSTIPTAAQAWRLPVDQKTWNGPKSLELREVKITSPKQGEVLVKVHAASINYRQVAQSNQLAYLLIQLRLTGYELLAI
jgi:hypothetical protein